MVDPNGPICLALQPASKMKLCTKFLENLSPFILSFPLLSGVMHVLVRSSFGTAGINLVLKSFKIQRIRSVDTTFEFYRLLL